MIRNTKQMLISFLFLLTNKAWYLGSYKYISSQSLNMNENILPWAIALDFKKVCLLKKKKLILFDEKRLYWNLQKMKIDEQF